MINNLIAGLLPHLPENLVWIFSKRYISGQTIEDVVRESKKLNQNGIMVTVDLLGEYIHHPEEANEYKKEYIELIRRFATEKINGNFSVKPSMFGLLLDREFCYQNLFQIVSEAARFNSFVKIDMEDSQCTSIELELFRRLKTQFPNQVGIVLQAYLKRTLNDIKSLLDLNKQQTPLNFRLCKGIYVEKEDVAYQKRQEIRQHYLEDLEFMLQNGIYVGIATHDNYLIEKAYEMIKRLNIANDRYEFQMLYGVAPKLRSSIVANKHHLRVYVPYGKQWFNYSTRRLKENPNMVWHILKAMIIRN